MQTVTLKTIHKDVVRLYTDIELIKNILLEEYELSDWAKKEIKKARETPESEYIDLNDL